MLTIRSIILFPIGFLLNPTAKLAYHKGLSSGFVVPKNNMIVSAFNTDDVHQGSIVKALVWLPISFEINIIVVNNFVR